ncbi:hypothetical protein LR48_Vigan272s002500 [Vigna angularis]|uniref:Uncharacterized protein n=1 Tax=Phaseolus angularis TaxID=3914 RepID=A0A0L9T772_PHAAN|nr:hypothetical protein LR48_Vigan272s002500 [Vigna angularis]
MFSLISISALETVGSQCEFGERSEEGERWNQKRHQKVQKKEPQLLFSGSLPLSGTQEFTGDPLRGKMAAKGKNRARALTAERVCIFGCDEANTLSSTPLKEDLGCSGYLFTFLGFEDDDDEEEEEDTEDNSD